MMNLRIFSLMLKHRNIDAQLRVEQARAWVDPARILKLKKLKLAIKDRLHQMTQGRTAHFS